MKIVTVSGSHSGVGKTYLAARLLHNLKNWSALKITVSHKGQCARGAGCGVCNKLKERFSIITDDSIITQKDTDTKRLKDAGAKEVIWLQTTPGGLKDGLKDAILRFKRAKGLIVESTSALKYIKSHLAIFLLGKEKNLKPSAREAIKKADIVLHV